MKKLLLAVLLILALTGCDSTVDFDIASALKPFNYFITNTELFYGTRDGVVIPIQYGIDQYTCNPVDHLAYEYNTNAALLNTINTDQVTCKTQVYTWLAGSRQPDDLLVLTVYNNVNNLTSQ